jgi:hypothetical protein
MSLNIYVNTLNQKQWENKAACFFDHNLYQTWAYQAVRVGKKNQELSHIEIAD